jgi:hypothetical protein
MSSGNVADPIFTQRLSNPRTAQITTRSLELTKKATGCKNTVLVVITIYPFPIKSAGRDTNTWVSPFSPEEENQALSFHQFRGITRGFGTEFKVIFPVKGKLKSRDFLSIDFQRGKANDAYWLLIKRFNPINKYLFDVVSTRVALTLGEEFLLDNFGKSGMLCFSLGGGVIFNSKQIYTHRLVYVYGSPFSRSVGEYHRQTHIFSTFPHVHFGLTFYFKTAHIFPIKPINDF